MSHRSKFVKNWRFIDDWYLNLGAGNLLVDSSGDLTEAASGSRRIVFPQAEQRQDARGAHPLLAHHGKLTTNSKRRLKERPAAAQDEPDPTSEST